MSLLNLFLMVKIFLKTNETVVILIKFQLILKVFSSSIQKLLNIKTKKL